MELLYDSARGQYIPQQFATECFDAITNSEDLKEDLDILKGGPDEEWYWDAWNNVLDKVELKNGITGTRHSIYQHDGDLWILDEGEEIPDEFND